MRTLGLLVFVLIFQTDLCSNDLDGFKDCDFHYWGMSWQAAAQMCNNEGKQLLCYKSKRDIDDLTETFRLSAIGEAELHMWLANKNCSDQQKYEDCLSLHIKKSKGKVWHFFLKDCSKHFPFICCHKNGDRFTTSAFSSSTTHASTKRRPSTRWPSSSTTSSTATCKGMNRRRISWPETSAGDSAIVPCPGNSIGNAEWMCLPSGKWSVRGPDMRHCRSLEVLKLKENFDTLNVQEAVSHLQNVVSEDKDVFGDDLVDVVTMMTQLPDRLFDGFSDEPLNSRLESTKVLVEKSADVADRIIELNDTWKDIENNRRSEVGSGLLSTVDGLGIVLSEQMDEEDEQSVIGKNIALQVVKPPTGGSLVLPKWPDSKTYNQYGKIQLEKGFDRNLKSADGAVSVIFTMYPDLSSMLDQQSDEEPSSILNSAVVSATVVQKRKANSITGKVRIFVEHLMPNPNNTACVFWNLRRNDWDTDGCSLESSSDNYSVCVCDHLTNFAVLMDYSGVIDNVDKTPFIYITIIGCVLSIICLAICVVVFSCYSYFTKHSWGLRYSIHRNLCLTLLIANLTLILGLDRTGDQTACAIIAGLLHYFFLSAFSWMLLEGVHIYLLLVVVFAARKSHWEKYYAFGYGFPLVIVAITAACRPQYYGTKDACWLSIEKGTIWAFMGPVALILIVNSAALVLAQWKASHISIKDDNSALIRRWLRVTFILFPILGITWIFGFMYVGKYFEVAGYLFAVFNSFQGFCIFVGHCVLDKRARSMVIASIKKKSSTINTGTSSAPKNKETVDSSSTNGVAKSKHETSRLSTPKIHRPWTFCFELKVTEKAEKELQSEQTNCKTSKRAKEQFL